MWTGRDDGSDKIHNRLFKCVNENAAAKLLGFACSLGVERNKGRVGAENAPAQIRKNMANFAIFDDFTFADLGDISEFENLEQADAKLLEKCNEIDDYFVLLGGGHESSLSPMLSLLNKKKTLGVINFDAHFDVRKQPRHSSGNSFYKAYEFSKLNGYEMNYLCLGASKLSNTAALFQTMDEMGAKYVLDTQFSQSSKAISEFLEQNEFIYISIDVDVFSASIAPGVSAPALFGITLQDILPLLKQIFASKKVLAADICEFNPTYDIDNHTAKLCAFLAYFLLRQGEI